MHVYIYDNFLNEGKYTRILAQIEARITDLGLNGKIGRLGVMKKTNELVRDEIKRGAKTIIAVGNDDTIEKIVRCMANSSVPLGIIPVGKKNNYIAESLGIEPEVASCDILSARRVEKMDLGMIGNFYFLSKLTTASEDLNLEIDSGYSVELKKPGSIRVINLATSDIALPQGVNFSPQDGSLQLLLETRKPKKVIFSENNFESVFTFKRAGLRSKNPIIFNDFLKVTGNIDIMAAHGALNVIVGKDRSF
ncbi:MAG: diacylglycerol kinase family protein [Patescibacteria group bacterium]|jgi:hypothetical protein